MIFNAFVLCQVSPQFSRKPLRIYKQGMSPNRFWFFQGQIFNEFNARKPEEINVFTGVTKNKLFMAIIGLTAVLQVSFILQLFLAQFICRNCWILTIVPLCIIQIIIIEFLGKFTSTVRLNWTMWVISLLIGIVRYGSMPCSQKFRESKIFLRDRLMTVH